MKQPAAACDMSLTLGSLQINEVLFIWLPLDFAAVAKI